MQVNYKYIDSLSEDLANSIISDLIQYSVFGFDTETTGLKLHINKPRLLQIAGIPPSMQNISEASIYVLDLWNLPKSFLQLIGDVLNFKYANSPTLGHRLHNGKYKKILFGHNLKFDVGMLWTCGIDVTGNGVDNVLYDTMLAEQLLKNSAGDDSIAQKGYFSLASLCKRYRVGYELDKTEQVSDWSLPHLSKSQIYYAALDAVAPYYVMLKQTKELEKEQLKEAALLDFRCLPAITAMEYYGVRLNTDKWNNLLPKYEENVKESQDTLLKIIPDVYTQKSWTGEKKHSIKLSSTSQLLVKLQSLGIPDPSGEAEVIQSSSKDTLLMINEEEYPWISDIVAWRKADKAITSFLQPLPDKINTVTNRLHTNMRQHGTITGRCSSTSPNMNQIPNDNLWRDCFEAETGNKIVVADYSGLELRLGAYVFKESKIITAYSEDINADIHSLTASLIYDIPIESVNKDQRKLGKMVNFLLQYSGGWKLLKLKAKTQFGVTLTAEEAQAIHKKYHESYLDIDDFHRSVFKAFSRVGKRKWSEKIYSSPRSFSGRRLKLVKPKSPNQIINFPVQGGAGDLGKRALANLYYFFKSEGYYPTADESIKFLLYVYDEIVLEAKDHLAEMVANKLQFFMQEAGNYYCKNFQGLILAEPAIGDSWASKT